MISKNPSLLNLNLDDFCFYNQATLNDESEVEDCLLLLMLIKIWFYDIDKAITGENENEKEEK